MPRSTLPLKKEIAFISIISVTVCLFVLIVSEFLIRISVDLYQCDNKLGWTFKTDSFRLKVSKKWEFANLISFGSYGIRHNFQPNSAHEFRILLLGDSFTAGVQVPYIKLYSSILQDLLNSDPASGAQKHVVVNAAVDGYGTTQEFLMFEKLDKVLDPQLILLQVFLPNDIYDNWPNAGSWHHWIAVRCGRPYFKPGTGDLQLAEDGSPITRPLSKIKRLLSNSVLYSLFVPFPSESDKSGPDFQPQDVWSPVRSEKVRAAMAHFQRVLKEFISVSALRGVPVVLIIMPPKPEVGRGIFKEGILRLHQDFTDYLVRNGIQYIDLLPFLRQKGIDRSSNYFELDEHLNERGHRIVARVVYDWLISKCDKLPTPALSCPTAD